MVVQVVDAAVQKCQVLPNRGCELGIADLLELPVQHLHHIKRIDELVDLLLTAQVLVRQSRVPEPTPATKRVPTIRGACTHLASQGVAQPLGQMGRLLRIAHLGQAVVDGWQAQIGHSQVAQLLPILQVTECL